MRLSDDEEEDEDPVLRGKRLWKQWQQSRMQQNEDDAAQGDEEDCSAAESLLQALSKSKKLKRFKPLSASLSVGDSLGDGSLRSSINVVGHAAAADAAASTVAPLVSAHIQQLSRTRCTLNFNLASILAMFHFFLRNVPHFACCPYGVLTRTCSSAGSFKVSSLEDMCVIRLFSHVALCKSHLEHLLYLVFRQCHSASFTRLTSHPLQHCVVCRPHCNQRHVLRTCRHAIQRCRRRRLCRCDGLGSGRKDKEVCEGNMSFFVFTASLSSSSSSPTPSLQAPVAKRPVLKRSNSKLLQLIE
jgi:hypothetical protein